MKFNNSYAKLDSRLFHKQLPTPLLNPRAGHFNPIVAKQIDWDKDSYLMDNWVQILSGSCIPEGFEPLAMAYAGHQFGHWAGQLGDGRGLLMAQVVGNDDKLTDLHLKGMGLTPFSRMGDGRAVLRSTIREYLCGHAMSSLGLASSNSLGFITSDTPVQRERLEPGAALLRVADTHIRLGHVEWIASFAPDLLPSFTKYMIETYYPNVIDSDTPILDFINQVVINTAKMIADWQLIGFAHGVMNTDNLSITGSTLDYGPFGFQERFDPAWINNHSDYSGRYAYQNQPAIGRWNLNIWMMHFMQLSGKTIFHNGRHSLTKHSEVISRNNLDECLSNYDIYFSQHYQQGICAKLGLSWPNENSAFIDETLNKKLALAFELLQIIEDNQLDYTNSFRSLIAIIEPDKHSHEAQLLNTLNSELNQTQLHRWHVWQRDYLQYIDSKIEYSAYHKASTPVFTKDSIVNNIKQNNPAYILRNSMAQKAIANAELNDFSEVDRLFELLRTPYEIQNKATMHDILPPNKDDKPIIVSCSS